MLQTIFLVGFGLAFLIAGIVWLMNRKSTGTLTLRVAGDKDALVNQSATTRSSDFVIVAFKGVELKAEGEERTEARMFAETKEIDLLAKPANLPEALFEGPLEAGRYEWIRLTVDAEKCRIMSGGVESKLHIPSAEQAGFRLVSGFRVFEDRDADFTVEFDVKKSLTKKPSGEFFLRPTLRLIDNNRPIDVPDTDLD